ncbi:sll1863 family stress response protein [Geomesophilobacter sediminis]|uniref:Uncharacterized protein n=1 Tax=Geomesophilobacter sediminis TaxID=2798584 RepID=A0A8J7J346_9BACT|nr:hypothetical protein [Geomesophilobacter sediminis]MBJ6725218.1 hypothetical protein [Geomesophilobacter sediminis]
MAKQAQLIEKLSAQMVEWDNQIFRLKDREKNSLQSPEDATALAALQQKRAEAAHKLEGMPSASGGEMEGLKKGTDEVWDEIRSGLRDAIIKVK